MVYELLPEVQKLSDQEKWKLANEICDYLIEHSDSTTLSEEEATHIDQIFEDYEADPEGQSKSWEATKKQIRGTRHSRSG